MSATLEEIKNHSYVLTPGRFVGAEDVVDDDTPFGERFAALKVSLADHFMASASLQKRIGQLLDEVSSEV